MKQVAAAAGVSVATVSRYIGGAATSPAAAERIQAAIDRLAYRPNRTARDLRAPRAMKIGLILSNLSDPFYGSILRGASIEFQRAGYVLLVSDSDDSPALEAAQLATMSDEGVSGVLIAPLCKTVDQYVLVRRAGIPLIFIDLLPRGSIASDSVTIDNEGGAHMALAHLLALGHRRIGYIGGVEGSNTADERAAGYRRALEEAGVAFDPALARSGGWKQGPAHEAMAALLALPQPPTAVLVANNMMTFGALQAVYERGLTIPGDLSLVAFDELPWTAAINPPVTTVAQEPHYLGVVAAETLLARIANPDRPRQKVVLDTRLIVRSSTAPPSR